MIYEFHCNKCDKRFEMLRHHSQSHKKARCPDCSQPAKKVISSFGINSGQGSRFPGVCNSFEGAEGVYIRDKSHFREECKKRDLTPVAL